MIHFIKLIEEKSKSITFYHQEKDANALENVLADLNNEYTVLKENLNVTVYLLDLIAKHHIKNKVTEVNHTERENDDIKHWLQSLIVIFEGLYNTATEMLNKEEIDFIKLETPKLINKKEQLEQQINHTNSMIIKTTVLLADIRNKYSSDITKGYSITKVARRIGEEFGKQIVGTYTSGRKKIIGFIEDTFNIPTIKSNVLIDLLEKSDTISYEINLPENTISYYFEEGDFTDEFVPLIGAWKINY